MKVINLSRLDNRGGSAKSAMKIHKGLVKRGINSIMYVGDKEGTDESIRLVTGNKWFRRIDKIWGELLTRIGFPDAFYLFSSFFFFYRDVRTADIIQLYNIHGGFFAYHQLHKLAKKSIVVWRLSDIWPMTGHCAYSYDCDKWISGCKKCNHLLFYPWVGRDHCAYTWKKKYKEISGIENMVFVAPSHWIMELAKQSPILQNKDIYYIPNGIDCDLFKPYNKLDSRKELGVSEGKFTILFLAANLEDERKGIKYFIEALKELEGIKDQFQVVCVGSGRIDTEEDIVFLGSITSDSTMAKAYSAADVFVVPTIEDNLPNTVLESMACRTPVVAFDVGGISDAVIDGVTGFLVKSKDSICLASKIEILLNHPEMVIEMGDKGYALVRENFTTEIQTDRFIQLYIELLKGKISEHKA